MRFMRLIVAIAVVTLWCFSIEASDRKKARRYGESAVAVALASTPEVAEAPKVYGISKGSDDALDEVNAYRAKQGLPPFQRDEHLTQAALACAKERAQHGIHGHLDSDFARLPAGAHADAAGCGALEDSWGWGTCCATDSYRYAGAAWVRGADGRRYMHLFVSHTANTSQKTPTAKPEATGTVIPTNQVVSSGGCSGGSCGVPMRFSRRGR